MREALSLGHNHIGTEHILLALTGGREGAATRVLLDLGAAPEKIRAETMRMLPGPDSHRRVSDAAARPQSVGVATAGLTARIADVPPAIDLFARWWKESGERELIELFYWAWDPIGVRDHFPYAVDEYNGYAPQVAQALRAGATEAQLVDILRAAERDHMGLDGNAAEHLRSAAARIINWHETSQGRWNEFGPLQR